MEHERKELLAQKRAQLKIKQKRAEIQQYKDRLTKSIEHFSQKYRYADEAEALKIETFISKLNFEQPGQLAIQEVCRCTRFCSLQNASSSARYRSW